MGKRISEQAVQAGWNVAASAGLRTAKLIKGARLLVVKGGPHCATWTHAEEVNAELLRFLGGKSGTSRNEAA